MSSDPGNKELLRQFILTGVLLGGATSVGTALARSAKITKRLKAMDEPELDDKDLLVVPIASEKNANDRMSDIYKYTAMGTSGVLSYLALSALFRRIEDIRMKKVEEAARDEAVESVVGPSIEKNAQLSIIWDTLSKLNEWRNVLGVATFLGAAALVKKRLDRENVDSQKLEGPKNTDVLFIPESRLGSGIEKPAFAVQRPVTGVSQDDRSAETLAAVHRALEKYPTAKTKVTGALMDRAGYGKMKGLLKVPLLKSWIGDFALSRASLGGSYVAGKDKYSDVNSFGPVRQYPSGVVTDPSNKEQTEQELADYGTDMARAEILADRDLRHKVGENAADSMGKFKSFFIKSHLKHHPGKVLDEIGMRASPGHIVTGQPNIDKAASAAYRRGYSTCLEKLGWGGPKLEDYLKEDNVKNMMIGTGAGAIGGALLGGPYKRTGGIIGGSLVGLIASNPQLFGYLISQGSKSVSKWLKDKVD